MAVSILEIKRVVRQYGLLARNMKMTLIGMNGGN